MQPRPLQAQRRRGFFQRYGWRAYAVPVLVVLTVLVVLQLSRPARAASAAHLAAAPTVGAAAGHTATSPAPAATTTPAPGVPPGQAVTATRKGESANPLPPAATPARPAPPRTTAATATPQATVVGPAGLASAALPAGENFVALGKGTWHIVKGTTPVLGTGGPKFTFSIEVEDGIEDAGADQEFAALVDSALADPRSWIGSGRFQLQRVDTGTPSFRISLTSQLTVRSNSLCGWQIHYEASCYARDVQRVAINDARWARGAVSFGSDRVAYRVYAINHEVGHALGYQHRPCPASGGPAPVMMQQSWSTADDDLSPLNPQLIPMDGKVCTFNPYPNPVGQAAAAATPAGG